MSSSSKGHTPSAHLSKVMVRTLSLSTNELHYELAMTFLKKIQAEKQHKNLKPVSYFIILFETHMQPGPIFHHISI